MRPLAAAWGVPPLNPLQCRWEGAGEWREVSTTARGRKGKNRRKTKIGSNVQGRGDKTSEQDLKGTDWGDRRVTLQGQACSRVMWGHTEFIPCNQLSPSPPYVTIIVVIRPELNTDAIYQTMF